MHIRALVVVAVAHLARASIEAEAEEAAVYTCDESRVRKSWTLFSAKEKATYVSAVKALSDAGHYSTFVGLHLMLGDFIHATAMFFPFNRLFVWEFENALRATAKEYACVTVPLWDWAADNQSALVSNALNATDATTPWAETHAFLSDMGGASNGASNDDAAALAADAFDTRSWLTEGNPEAPLLIYVGRLGVEKRLRDLKDVLERVPNARLAIVGKGPDM